APVRQHCPKNKSATLQSNRMPLEEAANGYHLFGNKEDNGHQGGAGAVIRPGKEFNMFGKGVRLFSLYGFEVRIDWSWLFIALLLCWSLALGVFPSFFPGLSISTYWLM